MSDGIAGAATAVDTHAGHDRTRPAAGLAVAALGIVYGDIGTSPLYSLRETFEGHSHHLEVVSGNVLGVVSLIIWALIVIVSIKYLVYILRADNHGEGGILALTALVIPAGAAVLRRGRWTLILLGLLGTALLYGDGMITPAISVLAAVEGTEVAAPSLTHAVLPISVVILFGLFAIQRHGSGSIGRLFGPVMMVWFATITLLGISHLAAEPQVLHALNPVYGLRFFADNGFKGFLALGAVFLAVTGGEALYADMGHFGRGPIRLGWFAVVLPALLFNYLGQGALLLHDPTAIESPFYRLAPSWFTLPLVVLATAATVIASQALISGVFSLTMQAIQMGYLPRLRIFHTSSSSSGQIYLPAVNRALMIACIALVIGFRTSANLAAAYGIAVTSTMVITTILFYVVLREHFGWRALPARALCAVFLLIDCSFFGANLFKIPAGGWFPFAVAGVLFAVMTTWHTGRRMVAERIRRNEIPLTRFLDDVTNASEPPRRVPGAAVYLFSTPGLTPPALIANVRHNHVLHEQVVVLSIVTDERPRVPPAERANIEQLGEGVYQVVLRYGFMEDPDVPTGVTEGDAAKLFVDVSRAAFFLGAEALVVSKRPGMARWREHLFAVLSRNATPAATYFGLPPDSTVTLGMQVEL
jgi:KUP system potassium uptake protein